jgi:hypothetical protein
VVDSEELRFGLNETITLEAWVKVRMLGHAVHHRQGPPRHEGVRREQSKLRAPPSAPRAGCSDRLSLPQRRCAGQKGRLASLVVEGHDAHAGWHHIAVTYTYGKPKSIKGFIDGNETDGTWDMGGATDRAPVTDGDAVVIGNGSTLAATHSFERLAR